MNGEAAVWSAILVFERSHHCFVRSSTELAVDSERARGVIAGWNVT